MFPFLCGFATGVYVGTYYDCKPTIEYIIIKIKENLPKDIPQPKPTDSPQVEEKTNNLQITFNRYKKSKMFFNDNIT